MKKTLVILATAITMLFLISACNSAHVSSNPVVSYLALATPCASGPVVYAGADALLCYNTAGIVINSQAEYDAAVCPGQAPAAAVDFSTKTLIGMRIGWNCGTSAGMTGITTDCGHIYINMARSTNCSPYTCNSYFSYTAAFLIDKTNLPVMVKTDTRQCDGSVVTDISPLL